MSIASIFVVQYRLNAIAKGFEWSEFENVGALNANACALKASAKVMMVRGVVRGSDPGEYQVPTARQNDRLVHFVTQGPRSTKNQTRRFNIECNSHSGHGASADDGSELRI